MEEKKTTEEVATKSYKISEAARILNVTPQTILNWKKRGWITLIGLPNGRWSVSASEIARVMAPSTAETAS